MRWPRFERRRRWLAPAALLVLVPKCGLCVLAYTGLGALLGLGGPELCSAGGDATAHLRWIAAGFAAVVLLAVAVHWRRRQRARA